MPADTKKKYIYYTDGKTNLRVLEGTPCPEGFHRGRVTRQLTPEQQQAANEARAKTSQARYGDAHYNNPGKSKQTCLEKYGTETAFAAETVKRKIKETCRERYGVDNVFQAEEVKNKIKNTVNEKYGVENISQAEENKDKVKATWESKSPEQMAEITAKREQTCYDRYGVKLYSCTDEAIEKVRTTCEERYGVPYFCMTGECRTYSSNNSGPNQIVADLLTKYNITYDREFIIDRKSYDFKVGNILIEVNPTATHNSTISVFGGTPLPEKYHYEKTRLAVSSGYRCLNIWDWDDQEKVIRQFLLPKQTVYARKCEVKLVSVKEKNLFLQQYHLQGDIKSEINLGLYYKDELVSLMTFDKPRYNKKFQYELIRYCSSAAIVGGAEKLFHHFVSQYNPDSVVSYCDLSKFTGNVYTKLGFRHEKTTIGRHWCDLKGRQHITDNLLRQRGYDQLFGTNFGKGTSNEELMLAAGFVEVYDAGQARYGWYK